MKIRNGYVSNSSSSSFIVIGTKINKNQVETILLTDEVIAIGVNLGSSGSKDDYIIQMTPRRYDLLNNSNIITKFNFYKVDYSANGDECKHNLPSIEQQQIFMFNKDYSSPETDTELIDWINARI